MSEQLLDVRITNLEALIGRLQNGNKLFQDALHSGHLVFDVSATAARTDTSANDGEVYVYRSGSTITITVFDREAGVWRAVVPGSYLLLSGGTLTGDLLFTDALYDIGKSGVTRPRDGFFSRNMVVGGTLGVTGLITASGGVSGVTHASTTGQTANDHHAQAHHAAHEPAGADPMAVDAAAATGSLRTLGAGATQAAVGSHAHTHASTTGQTATDHHSNANDPSTDEKAALAGTSGIPSGTNKYVTNADSRNTDSRTPTAHGASVHTDRTRTINLELLGGLALDVAPTKKASTGGAVPVWAFTDSSGSSVGIGFTIPDDYVSGGTYIIWHAMASDTNTGRDVKWRVVDRVQTVGASIEAPFNSVAGTSTNLATANFARTKSLTGPSTYTAGAFVSCLVTRLGADTQDTAVGDAELLGVQFQYTADG